jgi:NRPS condensation-like uncharacterized protein
VTPFGIVDELNTYFDSPAEPGNVHLEAWLPGHLDAGRLRAAAAAVLAAHPAARACRATTSRWRATYQWRIPPAPDTDPLSVTTDPDLDAVRTAFLATAPPLENSPPFRLLLASGPARDSLILNANHAAFDGHSCLVLLRLLAAAYSGRTPDSGPRPAGTPAAQKASQKASQGTGHQEVAPLGRAARIAPWHADRRAPGYGFRLLDWPGVPEPPRPGDGTRPTVNDLLVAALIETVERWNAARQRPPAPVRITVPVNVRAPGHEDDLGNLSAIRTVTGPQAGTSLLAAVAEQTSRVKQDPPGREVSAALAALARIPVPAEAKRRLLRLAVRWAGARASDTSLLTNLGNVTEPPSFGAHVPTHVWFSTTAHMPRGLSVGAITTSGRLHLCFRYRYALLGDDAAADFADEYAKVLAGWQAGDLEAGP